MQVEDTPRKTTADALYERIVDTGEPFWTVVYDPFMARDLTRADLRAVIARGLEETRGSYKGLVELFESVGARLQAVPQLPEGSTSATCRSSDSAPCRSTCRRPGSKIRATEPEPMVAKSY